MFCISIPGVKKKNAAPDIVDDGLDVVDMDVDSLADPRSATQSVRPAPAPIFAPTPTTIPSDALVGTATGAAKTSTARVPPDDASADAYKAPPSKVPPTSTGAATSAVTPELPPDGASAAAVLYPPAAATSGTVAQFVRFCV